MGRPSLYSDEDKARALAVLEANEGNAKRTARELDIPVETLRSWRKTWQAKGVPVKVQDALPGVVDEFVEEAIAVRSKALKLMVEKIEAGDAKVGELNAVVGTLTDKIRLIRGESTSRTESVHTGPTPQEFAAQLVGYIDAVASAQEERQADIIDAELVEQALPALPSATS